MLVEETALLWNNALSIRLRGFDPVVAGTKFREAIERSNPVEGGKWFLLGDAMGVCDEARAEVTASTPGKKGRQLLIAIEIGKRVAGRIGLGLEDAAAARHGARGADGMHPFMEVVGRVMWEVRKARLNARAESRKSGDIRRVARHVGFCMEHNGEKRRIAAENAVLDHGITHARMVACVSAGNTSSLFYGPEISNGRQTKDLGEWCDIMRGLVEDVDYNAEVDCIDNEADYYDAETVESRKREREEDREEWSRIVDELEAEADGATEKRKEADEKRSLAPNDGEVRTQRPKYDPKYGPITYLSDEEAGRLASKYSSLCRWSR